MVFESKYHRISEKATLIFNTGMGATAIKIHICLANELIKNEQRYNFKIFKLA
jgi:hypothetical protein